MNKKEKKAIKSLKRFVECKQDMTAVTASEIETVLNLLEKKDKEIDLMAKELVKAHEWFYSEFDNYTKEDFIKYFERKVENGN